MTPQFVDHIAFALLAVVFPIWGFFSIRRTARLIEAGRTELRIGLYRWIIAEEWLMAIAVLVGWFALGRGVTALGLVPQVGTRVWVGYGLSAALCVLFVIQVRQALRDPENLAVMRKRFGSVSFFLPHTRKEWRTFAALSVTAGICEELIYRGYLIAYLMPALGVPFWGAALVSSFVFGLNHAYQGLAGIPKTAFVGGLFALLYGMTGSLWAPIVLHAAMDVAIARISYAAFTDETPNSSLPGLAARAASPPLAPEAGSDLT